MKRKILMIALLILTVVNVTAFGTFAYKRWCPVGASCPEGETAQGRSLKQQLGLSDEQVAQMKTFQDIFYPKMEALSQKIKKERLDLVRELMKESPDSTRIERVLRHTDSLQVALQREVVSHLLLQKEVFTPAQQEKFFSMVFERCSVGMKQQHHPEKSQ